MELDDSPRQRRNESVVPMINVVFLLLIFFLMTATIAPPEPFDVAVPASETQTPAQLDRALFVGADGQLGWAEFRGDAVLPALAAAGIGTQDATPLIIRADRTVAGAEVARLLQELAALGITRAQLIAEARR